jgi:glycerophosphoryl diester phosphodiesterase
VAVPGARIPSFDWRTIALARRLNPRIETVALVWQYGPAECASLVDECSLRYTVNDEATMQRMIDVGVDGLISDDPDLLVEVAIRSGLR